MISVHCPFLPLPSTHVWPPEIGVATTRAKTRAGHTSTTLDLTGICSILGDVTVDPRVTQAGPLQPEVESANG